MNLPEIAQKLISEYSKPVTRPDWRKGTIHAQLFKYSPIFVDIKQSFKNVSEYYNVNYNHIFDTNFTYMLYATTFNEIIQLYSESVFNIYFSYKPEQMNFYRYCRLTAFLMITNSNIRKDIPTKMTFSNE
jgi:hypothetical protein